MTPNEATHPRVGSLICHPAKLEVIGIVTRYDEKAAYVRWPDHGQWHRFAALAEFELVPYTEFLPEPGAEMHDPIAWRATLAWQKNAMDW